MIFLALQMLILDSGGLQIRPNGDENELGYDMAKFCFRTEMNDWITALAVYFSGGDVESFTSRYHIRG